MFLLLPQLTWWTEAEKETLQRPVTPAAMGGDGLVLDVQINLSFDFVLNYISNLTVCSQILH